MQTYTYSTTARNVTKLHYCLDREKLTDEQDTNYIASLLQKQYFPETTATISNSDIFPETLLVIEEEFLLREDESIKVHNLRVKQINDPNLIEEQEGENFNEKLKNRLDNNHCSYHYDISDPQYVGYRYRNDSDDHSNIDCYSVYSNDTYLVDDVIKKLETDPSINIIDSTLQLEPIKITQEEVRLLDDNTTQQESQESQESKESQHISLFNRLRAFILHIYHYFRPVKMNELSIVQPTTLEKKISRLRQQLEDSKSTCELLAENKKILRSKLREKTILKGPKEPNDKMLRQLQSMLEDDYNELIKQSTEEDEKICQSCDENIATYQQEITFYLNELKDVEAKHTELKAVLAENQHDWTINESCYNATHNKTLYDKATMAFTNFYYNTYTMWRQSEITKYGNIITEYQTKLQELQQKISEEQRTKENTQQIILNKKIAINKDSSELQYTKGYINSKALLAQAETEKASIAKQIWLYKKFKAYKSA